MSSIDTLTNPVNHSSKQVLKKVIQDDHLPKKDIIEFDWKNKWLKGNLSTELSDSSLFSRR
jgi:hypothetical protein